MTSEPPPVGRDRADHAAGRDLGTMATQAAEFGMSLLLDWAWRIGLFFSAVFFCIGWVASGTPRAVGLVLSLLGVVVLVVGRFSRRFGRRPWLVVALGNALWIAAVAAMAAQLRNL